MSTSYAGDITPKQAWEMMEQDPSTRLVDVRTGPEWKFVGVPNLQAVGQEPVLLAWQVFPTMEVDAGFVDKLAASGLVDKDAPIVFLCRSGARSAAAAAAMTAHGYTRCYNILGGFEGGPDAEGHRGMREGWKAEGLPWRQD